MSPSSSNLVRLNLARALSGDDCRLLVESVVDYAIFMLDPEGRVATWNRGAERIHGFAAEEIIGQHFSTFYAPGDLAVPKVREQLELARGRERLEDEGWRLRQDGSKFWANVIITALRVPTGELRGFGVVVRDQTARRSAEEQLRRAEERWHLLVDAVVDYAIFMLDPAGRVATWNVGASKVKGYDAEEIIGRHFSAFYTPEDREAGRPEQILSTVRREGRYEDESWRVRKDGTRFWANVIITALRDQDGQLLGFAKVTRDLSARREAEDALRRSEERFRLLVENVADYAIYMLDLQGRVTTWNLGAQRMKGYSAQEIIGRNFACFFPAEDAAEGKPERELVAARERGRFEDEGWRVRKDGSRFWANAVITALHDARGTLTGFAKITRDLTDRRQSEQAERQLLVEQTAREVAQKSELELRQSRAQYRALSRRLEIVLEGVADGITVEDRTGRIVFANSAAARIWGYATGNQLTQALPAEVQARFELLDAEGQPLGSEQLPARRVFAGSEAPNALLHVRERHSQRDWWLLVRAGAVLDAHGAPELAISIWHDVTARHRHEVQAKYLAEATAALGSSLVHDEMLGTLARMLVPGMGDCCAIYLVEGDSLREVARAHAGAEKHRLALDQGRRSPPTAEHAGAVWAVIHGGAPAVFNDISEARRHSSAPQLGTLGAIGVSAVLIAPLRVGPRVIGAMSLLYFDPGRRYDASDVVLIEKLGRRVGVALDNAQLYRAAQEAANRAEEASRAKDEFLAIVSHELRTPLSAILGWATLLRDRVKDAEMVKPIEVIHRNAQAQVKIIDDILDVSRVITGKFRLEPKPMDLVAVAREALEVVRPSADAKKIQLEFAPGDAYCLLVADPQRLQQAIWNLLSNAVKFTDAGGRVGVALAQEAAHTVLTVEDNGRGIEPSLLTVIFDRFKQADSSTTRRIGGLGLGLSLVRHIIELHGGHVSAHSAGTGKGARFTIRLPTRAVLPASTQAPASAQPEPKSSAWPGARVAGLRVLVVDDERDACNLIATVLVEAGAQVQTARSAAEAFAIFRRFRPDVLISDIGMPGEDGYSLIRRIRALPGLEGGSVPALALTAFAREEDRAKTLAAGFTTHVRKPLDLSKLTCTIAELAGVDRDN
ncbi:MAG TPA: PAS domain S-box protein [Polyangiaceae bacterium]|nr:PAS domain S-box protein [Polyangiaceae bacterium]